MNLVSTIASQGGDVGTAKNAASVISARQNKYERGRAGDIIWRDFSEGKGSSKQKEQQEQDSLFLHFQSSQNKTYVAYAWDCLGILLSFCSPLLLDL